MQTAFNAKFSEFLANKSFTHVPNSDKFDTIVTAVKKSLNNERLNPGAESAYARRYSIAEINGVEKLVQGNKIVVKQEEVSLFLCFWSVY